MSNPDDNLPPQTSKFFDIIPANKRSQASPTSRPLISKSNPSQADMMINTDQQPDPIEVISEQPSEPEPDTQADSENTEILPDSRPQPEDEIPPPIQTDIEQPEAGPQPFTEETDTKPQADENTPPPVQTDIEQADKVINTDQPVDQVEVVSEQPTEEELLLPAEATPDEVPTPEAVVIRSPGTSKSFRLRTWLIALLFIIIIAVIALLLYLFVFKSNVTNTPGSQFFGN